MLNLSRYKELLEIKRPEEAKTYLFLNLNISGMFDDLFEGNFVELLEIKRLEKATRTIGPKNCKYHHLVGHPIHDFIFKEKVMELAY